MVPPGGFLRGEQFERERVVPPLSRLLCFLSCRSKKGRPPAGRTSRFDDSAQLKKFMVSIPTSKYHPIRKPSAYLPQAPSVTAAPCQLPPGGSYEVRTFPHGFVLLRSACCAIPQSRLRRASSLSQGSLFVRYRYCLKGRTPGKHMLSGSGFTGSGRLKFQESGFSSGLRPHHRRKG